MKLETTTTDLDTLRKNKAKELDLEYESNNILELCNKMHKISTGQQETTLSNEKNYIELLSTIIKTWQPYVNEPEFDTIVLLLCMITLREAKESLAASVEDIKLVLK